MTRRARRALLILAALGAITATMIPAVHASAATLPTCSKTVNFNSHALPAASNNAVDCLMSRGAFSDAVATLQRALNACYRAPAHQTLLVVDKDFGGNTEAALIDAQSRSGTAPDGHYGPNTRRALRWQSNDVPNVCSRA